MGKFKKKKGNDSPQISTASLPDIVFILLFFFMVVTVMREDEQLVRTSLPKGTEYQKLERKSLVSHVYIGQPTGKYKEMYGSAPRIQLNDVFATPDDIGLWVENERLARSEKERPFITASMKVDKEATMGIVSDVKTELRKSNQLLVNYAVVGAEDITEE